MTETILSSEGQEADSNISNKNKQLLSLSTETKLSTEQKNSVTNLSLDDNPISLYPSTGMILINDTVTKQNYLYKTPSLSKETTLSTETVLSTEQLNSITNIVLDESPKLPHPSTGSPFINDIGQNPSYLYRTPNLSIENTFRTESDTRINDIYLNSSKYEGKTPKRKTQILPKKKTEICKYHR